MISSVVVIQARSQSAPSPDRSAFHGEVTIGEEWAKQWRSPMLSIMNSDTAIAQQISQQRREGQKRNQQTLYERLVTVSVDGRVAELSSLSSGAKMAMKIFVKRVFTIFASNASFLRVIANLQN